MSSVHISRDNEGTAGTLADIPADQRNRILTGMRWSVWLSSAAVPFGAAINLLLARVSPEAIGIYGLLSVYVGLIAAFLYFGGDTVVIKFVPECKKDDQFPFLVSYLLVVLTIYVLLLVLAYFCPAAMRLVLGQSAGDRGNFLLLCLAPIPIVFFGIVASLKGMLEIKFSQTLAKLLTMISLLAYALLFVVDRRMLASNPATVVWGIYLVIAAALASVGAVRVCQLCGRPRIRFYLPKGFWRYAIDTQQVGIVYFFTNRIDYLLILNFGGVAILGKYVAVMAVAATVPMTSNLFMETLLPSLVNMIATGNNRAAAQVFIVHMRILFLVTVSVSCAIMVLAVSATAVMGPKYRSLESLIILMTMVQGIANPGAFGGTLLSSIGRQRLAVWTGLLNATLFSGLFFGLWHHWNLTGAVLAYGAAILISNGSLMAIALRTAPIYPSIVQLWVKAALAQLGVGMVTLRWMPLGLLAALVTWAAGLTVFLWASHYDLRELKLLVHRFVPGSTALLADALAVAPKSIMERN